MCGRTACTLCPSDIKRACSYKDKNTNKYKQPEWIDITDSKYTYKPSHNVAPTDVSPVLVAGTQFQKTSERIVHPMLFGMIPPWHKGNINSHGLSTNNCRIETLPQSKMYSPPLTKGQRCVIVCDGFYEWQTTRSNSKTKQPYFIYMKQPEGICIENPDTWSSDWSEEDGWKGPKLLCMAGLYNKWTSPEGETVYSYTIITMESDESLSWLHHRMPAILHSDYQIEKWLDFENIKGNNALDIIQPVKLLTWHPVSTLVNNSRVKDPDCNKKVTLNESKPKSASSMFMKSWLGKSMAADKTKSECEADVKKMKLEPSEKSEL